MEEGRVGQKEERKEAFKKGAANRQLLLDLS